MIKWYNKLEPYRIENNIPEEYRNALSDRFFVFSALTFILGLLWGKLL